MEESEVVIAGSQDEAVLAAYHVAWDVILQAIGQYRLRVKAVVPEAALADPKFGDTLLAVWDYVVAEAMSVHPECIGEKYREHQQHVKSILTPQTTGGNRS